MRPNPDRTLQGVAMTLLTDVMREVQTPFGQSIIGMAAMLTMMVAEEFERGADRLVVENAATRDLLGAGLEVVSEAQKAAIVGALATPAAPNYRGSSLQAENDALRAGLIQLHAMVEQIDSPAARALDARIWEELIESTRRREFSVRV
ncbi:MAG TPA: hypothetical protein PJ994_12965 [Tepidiformaceae bacterium]|nr:hypothetical protein [Tepidiformaceae bacterium]